MSRKKRSSVHKDRFIDLAQAALEEADLEDDRKGLLEEVVEALISKTGAPMLSDVIAAQLESQDVIERTAEQHFLQQQQQQHNNNNSGGSEEDSITDINQLKEQDDPATILPPTPSSDSLSSLASSCSSSSTASSSSSSYSDLSSTPPTFSYWQSTYVIGDYLWRLFRVLILASLVALLYQFYLHHHYYFEFLYLNSV